LSHASPATASTGSGSSLPKTVREPALLTGTTGPSPVTSEIELCPGTTPTLLVASRNPQLRGGEHLAPRCPFPLLGEADPVPISSGIFRASIAPGGAAISRLARLAPQMVDEASLCYRASISKRGTSAITAGDASCWPARTEISTAIGSGIGQRKAIDFFGASMSAPA